MKTEPITPFLSFIFYVLCLILHTIHWWAESSTVIPAEVYVVSYISSEQTLRRAMDKEKKARRLGGTCLTAARGKGAVLGMAVMLAALLR
jgi:hypothetical protein